MFPIYFEDVELDLNYMSPWKVWYSEPKVINWTKRKRKTRLESALSKLRLAKIKEGV